MWVFQPKNLRSQDPAFKGNNKEDKNSMVKVWPNWWYTRWLPRRLGEERPLLTIKKYRWSYISSPSDNSNSVRGQHISNFSAQPKFSHDPDKRTFSQSEQLCKLFMRTLSIPRRNWEWGFSFRVLQQSKDSGYSGHFTCQLEGKGASHYYPSHTLGLTRWVMPWT